MVEKLFFLGPLCGIRNNAVDVGHLTLPVPDGAPLVMHPAEIPAAMPDPVVHAEQRPLTNRPVKCLLQEGKVLGKNFFKIAIDVPLHKGGRRKPRDSHDHIADKFHVPFVVRRKCVTVDRTRDIRNKASKTLVPILKGLLGALAFLKIFLKFGLNAVTAYRINDTFDQKFAVKTSFGQIVLGSKGNSLGGELIVIH